MEENKCKCGGDCQCKKVINSSADMDTWLNDLETKLQPEACTIDNPDCENCGS